MDYANPGRFESVLKVRGTLEVFDYQRPPMRSLDVPTPNLLRHMRHPYRAALRVVLLAVLACRDATQPSDEVGAPLFAVAGEQDCGSFAAPPSPPWNRYWSCGSQLGYSVSDLPAVGADSQHRTAFHTAANAWNTAMQPDVTGIPKLARGGSRLRITTNSTGGIASGWSGQVQPSDESQTPTGINFSQGATSNPGPFLSIALNELARIYGIDDLLDSKERQLGVNTHCAFSVASPNASKPCQHDIELVKWIYGIRQSKPNLAKHIVTGINLSQSAVSIAEGASTDVELVSLQFSRVNPAFDPETLTTTAANARITLIPVSGSGSVSLTRLSDHEYRITGGTAGQLALRVTYSSQVFERTDAVANEARIIPVTVTPVPVPPAGPPTGVSVVSGSVTSSSAIVSWTAGDLQAQTVVQYLPAGQGAWTTANGGLPVQAGQIRDTLAGLLSSTTYSVRLYHVRGGLSSDTLAATNLFTTSAPPPQSAPSISAFWASACSRTSSGGKLYNTWTLSWNGAPPSGLTFYTIRQSSINDPATGTTAASGKVFTAAGSRTVGPFPVSSSTPDNKYFWLQQSNGGGVTAWFPLADSPLNVAGECAV